MGSSESSRRAEEPRCLDKSSRSVFEPLRSWLCGFTLLGRWIGAGRWIGWAIGWLAADSKRSFSDAEGWRE
jgi:hypothetical protein